MNIGFVGGGKVGTALAVALAKQGYCVSSVASRSFESSQRLAYMVNMIVPRMCVAVTSAQAVADRCDLVFVTVPDDAVVGVIGSTQWRTGQYVVFCGGALSVEDVNGVVSPGVVVGGFHPLQSFADLPQALANIPGSTFGLEAEGDLFATLCAMAEALGGHWVRVAAEDKVLYHIAGVMTSNYAVALMKMATDLFERFGADRAEATRALMPLLNGTALNIERIGLPDCLTGPIARGDYGIVERHIAALEKKAPDLVLAYCELGLQALDVAIAKGSLTDHQIKRLRIALSRSRLRVLKGASSDARTLRRASGAPVTPPGVH